ncbi:hypothetical protein [Pseudoduganella sp. OTU4001]|uniref:hypothetical protein n=1 Tax=Pseudoduganella sp. OTU4001 TaxID=3043854 RepID=UPI00313BC3CA
MRQFATALVFAAAAMLGGVSHAADTVPAYIGKHVTSQQDTDAINKIIQDFQAAIIKKDQKLLSTLVLNSNILFDAPADPKFIAEVRNKLDVTFDGLRSGGFNDFARFIATSKEPVEEKFYNVKITQDGHVAWVMFDYEFQIGGKTQNHGIETWQMMKNADNQWKIASVMWTMNRP